MAKNKSSGGATRAVKGHCPAKGSGISIPGQDANSQLQMFRSLADYSLEFIGICDLQFKPFYVNEAGMKLVGLDSLEEACAVKVQDFFFPEDQRYISEDFFPKVLREGRGEVEIRFRHFKTGAALWMIYNVFQVRDARGQVSGYATVSRNITERKQAEEALQSAALFPEENPFPVLRVDSGGKLLFANRSAGGLLAVWGCAVGDRVPEVEGAVRKALEAGGAQELEIAVSERIVSFVLMPIRERGYVNLYGRDVTEQKRAQVELRKSEERFHGLFEDDLAGDFICTAEGRIVLCNPAFARIFGFPSAQEAVGTNMRDLYLEPEERGALVERVKRERKIESFEGWQKRRDGKPIHVLENLVGHFDEGGGLVEIKGYIHDDTNRKRAEEEVRQKAEELRAVLDAAPVAVWIAQDRECRVITGNAYADELIMGTARRGNISMSAPPGAAAVTYQVFRDGVELGPEGLPAQRATATGKQVPAFEMELVFPNGRRLNLMAGAVPLFDGQGNVRGAIVAGLDVTPLKKAQEAAREERDFSTAVLETAGALVVVLDTSGRIKRFNRACAALTGYAEEEVLGQPVWSLIPPEDVAGVRQEWSRLNSGTLKSRHENRWLARDGTRRLIAWSNTVLVGANGEILNVIGTGLDVTEQRQAEEALKESEARMARAQAIAHLGSWELDTRNNQLTWSDEVYRIFGFETQSFPLTYRAFLEAVHPEDRAAVDARYSASLREGKEGYEMEHRVVRAGTGEVRIVHEKCEHLRDESGCVVRSQGMVHDITERKQAEEALERSQARLTQGVGVAGLGIFEHDHLTDVIEFSPLMRELLGFGSDEEVTVAAIIQKVVPEDREGLAARIARAHDPGGDGHFEVDYRVPDRSGGVRWVSARSQTFFGGEGSERRAVRTIGAALDVTERRESEAQLERLVAERTARLQELVGELEHFSYTITHDLKSPLRAMRGFAEVVQQMGVEPDAKPFLERISTAAERMDRLIADALSYSRSMRQDLPLEDVDTGALLRGILDSYPQFQPWKAQIRVEGCLPVVLGNAAGLTQCFSNLLGNAVKFVKPGEKPEIRVWATEVPAHGRHSEWVRIWVEDKGIGISKEMLPRVFEMFSRGSKDYEGTGIGLALARKVVQRMGGKVGVESEEGEGSRFWIELGRGEARAVFSQDIARQQGSAGEGTVLYVEDEENDAIFMERAFAEKGLGEKLRLVGTGRAAIEYLSGSGEFADREEYPVPSVVLLDLNLPQVSGFGVLEWIRNHPDYKRMPVVVFSSSTREDDEVKARELGANEFVSKPSSGMEFGRVVERLRAKWMG